jgi:hypothetical protein
MEYVLENRTCEIEIRSDRYGDVAQIARDGQRAGVNGSTGSNTRVLGLCNHQRALAERKMNGSAHRFEMADADPSTCRLRR